MQAQIVAGLLGNDEALYYDDLRHVIRACSVLWLRDTDQSCLYHSLYQQFPRSSFEKLLNQQLYERWLYILNLASVYL